jgi:hypothetical protein
MHGRASRCMAMARHGNAWRGNKERETVQITITVEGISPLLLHAFTDEAQMAATNGSRSSAASSDRGSPQEQAETHLYRGINGDLIIPQPNLFSCLIEGGKFFKAGKSKITTMRSSLIPACVQIQEIEIPLQSDGGWTVDTRAVRIPATGGRIQRHRPCFHDWRLTLSVELDTAEITEKLLREIVDAAGSKIGLGDFRPATKGPFGRFKVVHWQKAEMPLLKAA